MFSRERQLAPDFNSAVSHDEHTKGDWDIVGLLVFLQESVPVTHAC